METSAEIRALIRRLGGVMAAARALGMPHTTMLAVAADAGSLESRAQADKGLRALAKAEEMPTDPNLARPA